ncbi:MAG: lipoate--protein ligase family protein [Planctomycetota bacterium]
MSTQCRLMIDDPAEGSWNMALDEYLLAHADELGPTLRFYAWSNPTLSLGYFQKYDDRESHPSSLDCDCVRRHSGGGAILHDQEVTYSLIVPTQDRWSKSAEQLYTKVHEALIHAYATFGANCEFSKTVSKEPFLCFQRRAVGDILFQGNKITGSAQRRHKGTVLQHGSILVTQSTHAPELPGLSDLTETDWDQQELIAKCAEEIGTILQLEFTKSHELDLTGNVHTIQESKFATESWTKRR